MVMPYLANGLVIVGALILAVSLFTTRRLIARLGRSPVRNHWYGMLVLVVIFIAGYLGYLWAFWNTQTRLLDLIVPGIFFLGACFVWLTATLSLQTAVAVMRISLLEEENVTDPLTGVFNRRYFDRRLNEEVTRARRYGLSLSILLLDIDHFKQINDRYGHPVGDQTLVYFARLVKEHLREPDILARHGGEEFMVIAPNTALQGAIDLAERLRARLESGGFVPPDSQDEAPEIRLTCSIGVGSLGASLDRADKLLQFVDENLYRAKREGRNRVSANEAGASVEPMR